MHGPKIGAGRHGLSETWRAVLQTGVAAGGCWWLARDVLGHPAPLSAPVVAIVSIGAAFGQRRRRMLEVVLGITVGVGVATVLVAELGRGALLLGLLVAVAMSLTLAIRGGELLATQSAITSILVFAGGKASLPAAGARCLDALLGGATTALVSVVVVPLDPSQHLARRIEPLLSELAGVLSDIAATLRGPDADLGERALQRARDADQLVTALHRARPAAIGTARFALIRRRSLAQVRRTDAAAVHIDHTLRHTRVLARAALAAAVSNDPAAAQCAAIPQQLGEAVDLINAAWRDGRGGYQAAELASSAAGEAAGLQRRSQSLTVAAVAAASYGIADDLALAVAEHSSATRELRTRSGARSDREPTTTAEAE